MTPRKTSQAAAVPIDLPSSWRRSTPVLVSLVLVTMAGALYTFKFGWSKGVYITTGLAFSIACTGVIARTASWTKSGVSAVPVPAMLFAIAGIGALWPALLIAAALGGELYMLQRFVKYLAGGSGAAATGFTVYLLCLLGAPLLVLGLFIIGWLVVAIVGPPVW